MPGLGAAKCHCCLGGSPVRELNISRYRSRHTKDKDLLVEKLSWDKIAKLLTDFKVTPETFKEYASSNDKLSIKDVGWHIGGLFTPPRRKACNLVSRSTLSLDLDFLESWDVENIRAAFSKLEYVVHSSHSHRDEAPRLRLVFPLTRDISPEEYEPLGRKVAEKLGLDFFDSSTWQPSRVMFLPSRSVNGAQYIERNSGRWLDPDKVLKTYKDWRDFGEWPLSSAEKEKGFLQSRKERAANPFEIPGVIGAFNRVYPIDETITEFDLPYTESGHGNGRYTYAQGTSVDGAEFFDSGHLYIWHSSDPACGNRNSFDLVRIHRFRHLDEGQPLALPIREHRSQIAMLEFAMEIPAVLKEWGGENRIVHAEDEFEDLGNDLDTSEKRKVNTVKFEAIREQMAEWGANQELLTTEQVEEIVLRAAAGYGRGLVLDSQLDILATALKQQYPYGGVTKASIVQDIKSRHKVMVRSGTDGEKNSDIQVEFLQNFLDSYYHGGAWLKRTGKQFWAFAGTHWHLADDEFVSGQLASSIVELRVGDTPKEKRALAVAVGENQTSAIFSSLWTMFKTLRTLATGGERDPMGLQRQFLPRMINCLSGEIYFNERGRRQLRPHNPDSLTTNVIPVEWDKNAECPEWDRFCSMTFSKAKDQSGMQRHLEELCGYVLNQSREFRVWVLFYGGTASGKTTIGKVLNALMRDTVKNMALSNYAGDNNIHATAGLLGKQLLLDDDYSEGVVLPDGLLKSISEEKNMDANPKGKDEVAFVARVVPLICSNSPPGSRDTTGALFARALVFPFNHTVPLAEQDERRMRAMISNELPGIFARFVGGLSRLYARGGWDFPFDCTRAWALWKTDSNPLPLFIGACYTETDAKDGRVVPAELYRKYLAFMQDESPDGKHSRRLSRNHFYRKIDSMWGLRKRSSDGEHWYGYAFVPGSVNDGSVGDEEFDNTED